MRPFKTATVIFLIIYSISFDTRSHAQIIDKKELLPFSGNAFYKNLLAIYEKNAFATLWNEPSQKQALLEFVSAAASYGLNPKDYSNLLLEINSSPDTGQNDIHYSLLAIHFFHDLIFGNSIPDFKYQSLIRHDLNSTLTDELLSALQKKNIKKWADQKQPTLIAYSNALRIYNSLLQQTEKMNYRDTRVMKTPKDSPNVSLQMRLSELGIAEITSKALRGTDLVEKTKTAQKLFGLAPDGQLNTATLRALNTPLKSRVDAMRELLNYFRWSHPYLDSGHVIMLNIPSCDLKLFEKERLVFSTKVITGKPSTPTPTLTSTIKEIILYPYWIVPYKIATQELLPKIKRNKSYLAEGNYQVLNRNGKVVNPASINWSDLSPSNFPYILRQSTGCDNSLGIIKFDFENPFQVYLHDTPGKSLFSKSKRFFSHGCMRIEKAIELGRILLAQDKKALDTLTEKGCLLHQEPLVFKANVQPVLMVSYQTAWFDNTGSIVFYEDIYDRRGRY